MKKLIFVAFIFIGGCSSEGGYTENSYPSPPTQQPTPRIHGDERSNLQRYNDCLSASKKSTSKSERARCFDRSQRADPDYWGVTFPMNF